MSGLQARAPSQCQGIRSRNSGIRLLAAPGNLLSSSTIGQETVESRRPVPVSFHDRLGGPSSIQRGSHSIVWEPTRSRLEQSETPALCLDFRSMGDHSPSASESQPYPCGKRTTECVEESDAQKRDRITTCCGRGSWIGATSVAGMSSAGRSTLPGHDGESVVIEETHRSKKMMLGDGGLRRIGLRAPMLMASVSFCAD